MEKWIEIRNFPKYEISSFGRVRSYKKKNCKILKPKKTKQGYLRVGLHSPCGERFFFQIHRLVIEAFVGAGDNGNHVAHMDGNPKNNNIENLKWCTPKENNSHKKIHGTNRAAFGEGHGMSKINMGTAKQIYEACNNGLTQREIAKNFGISQQLVSNIKLKKSWGHLWE